MTPWAYRNFRNLPRHQNSFNLCTIESNIPLRNPRDPQRDRKVPGCQGDKPGAVYRMFATLGIQRHG